MKIFIDSTMCVIYEWEDRRIGAELFRCDHRYPFSFQRIVDDILTPAQQTQYCTGNDIAYRLSKKKQAVLAGYIQKQKIPNN